MNLAEFAQYLINGMSQGAIYALIALGYTMVYGILKMINFAHGEFYMVGAFFGFIALTGLQVGPVQIPPLPFWLAFPAAMIATGLLAMFVERFAYRPLRGANRIVPLITALGVSIVLLEGMRVTMSAQARAFPQPFEQGIYTVGQLFGVNPEIDHPLNDIIFQKTQIVIFITAIVLMYLLNRIVMKTKMGRAMRALSFDFDASQLMGVPINRVISFTFFVGAALAAVAGILVGMHYNQVEPYMGQLAGVKAFSAAVLGGIGSIPGAVLGAFLLGISEALVVGYGESTYRDAIAFGILIFVLMIRPWGLLGKPERVKV
jgi:branched-chain amino acid transport system permease protein